MHIYDAKLMAKIGRSFKKAGFDPSKEAASAFVDELLTIGVPILHRSSGRIARVIRGETTAASLLIDKRKGRADA